MSTEWEYRVTFHVIWRRARLGRQVTRLTTLYPSRHVHATRTRISRMIRCKKTFVIYRYRWACSGFTVDWDSHTACDSRRNFKGQHQCKFFRKSVFFGIKFILNLLEYEAKGFIHEKKKFCLISRFSCGVSDVSHTATCAMNTTQNFKRVFLETRFFKTARTITRTIFNIFFSNFNHIFQKTFWRETRTDFSIS